MWLDSIHPGECFGEEASMVMQWTVNPPPSGTTGSIPVFSTILGISVIDNTTDFDSVISGLNPESPTKLGMKL